MTPEQIARFWAKVDKSDACWVWRGAQNGRGYGAVGVNGRMQGAHRIAYTLTYGPIPAGLLVCHRCDNPPCVRPEHLFIGTYKDNTQDAWLKGRPLGKPRGTQGPSKITFAAAQEIRALHAAGVSGMELSRRYGVKPSVVYPLLAGKTWMEDPKIKRERSQRARQANSRIQLA